METYTAQEWQIKFKEQAGKDKQLLHDLNCTALVKTEEVNLVLSDLKIYRKELEKMREAYCDVATKIASIFNEIESITLKRRMAELFKFAYMEAEFEDMRAKWPNQECARMVAQSNCVDSTKGEK
jgi:hypothetical protein